jgi:hypothetical protein
MPAMIWLRRILAPRNRPFVVFAAVLVPMLAGAHWYKGSFGRRQLARVTSSARRALTDKAEIPKLKMERSSLEFQLPNLSRKYPILTNAPLARDWSSAAVLSQLDPEVCQAWRAYLDRVSPLVLQREPDLQTYAALEAGYEADVESLARDAFASNKQQRLADLRTKKFAALFTQSAYVADGARFTAAADGIVDEPTVQARKTYGTALAASVVRVNPKLAGYAHAEFGCKTEADAIRLRLNQLDEQLGNIGEPPATSEAETGQSAPPPTAGALASLQSLHTYVPQGKDFPGIEVGCVVLAFVITLPVELRHRRWLKIGASAALVYFGLLALRVPFEMTGTVRADNLFGFFGYLVPAVLLAALWTPDLTFSMSKAFVQLIDSGGPEETENSSLRPAYRAASQGELRLALDLLKPKLLAEPGDYEALVLKARLHRQLNHNWRTKLALKEIQRHALTQSQRTQIEQMLGRMHDATAACWQLSPPRTAQVLWEEPAEQTEPSQSCS